jgi:CubicO group peptidase (beta-lactamase class C family)
MTPTALSLVILAAFIHASWNILLKGVRGGLSFLWLAHSPQILTGFSPLTELPTFYGLGWNVNYDGEGRLRLEHSGAFALGAATTVLLVPSEDLGVVILTNAYPIGLAEGLAFTYQTEGENAVGVTGVTFILAWTGRRPQRLSKT